MCLSLKTVPSKSHTMRALLFALMARGTSIIHRPLPSPDTDAMIGAICALGARVKRFYNRIEVVGTGGKLHATSTLIDAGNSGQVLRFVGALAALQSTPITFTGDHSIRTLRPMQPLLDGLFQLGARTSPFTVGGPITSGQVEIDGSDSQPVSALLMASAFLPGPTRITVRNPGETPWVALTLHWLKRFGIDVTHDNFTTYAVPGGAAIDAFTCTIPGDYSSATYPLAAALVTGTELALTGLDPHDVHPDKGVLGVLRSMGAQIEEGDDCLHIKPSALLGQTIDVNPIIDALPLLAVLGCFAQGKTLLTGGKIARCKESDRIRAIVTELKKMGAAIEERDDGLIVQQSTLSGAHLSSYGDHRIALALSVAALGASGPTHIDDTACIAKSYPTFFEDLEEILMKGSELRKFDFFLKNDAKIRSVN